mmetsp:Transcript_1742/g.4532  ORF Transcript_1742/g.4532 Transcript_1742/m.4532 type:complete len:266 (-) Transcript_1742:317-1114(-)
MGCTGSGRGTQPSQLGCQLARPASSSSLVLRGTSSLASSAKSEGDSGVRIICTSTSSLLYGLALGESCWASGCAARCRASLRSISCWNSWSGPGPLRCSLPPLCARAPLEDGRPPSTPPSAGRVADLPRGSPWRPASSHAGCCRARCGGRPGWPCGASGCAARCRASIRSICWWCSRSCLPSGCLPSLAPLAPLPPTPGAFPLEVLPSSRRYPATSEGDSGVRGRCASGFCCRGEPAGPKAGCEARCSASLTSICWWNSSWLFRS